MNPRKSTDSSAVESHEGEGTRAVSTADAEHIEPDLHGG